MLKHCARCGKEFEVNPFQSARKYCSDECSAEAERERKSKYNRERRRNKVAEPPKPTKEQGKRCKRYSCLYHPIKSAPNGCDYTLVTGELRGCAPGEGCICYKRGSAKERQRMQIENAKNQFWGW